MEKGWAWIQGNSRHGRESVPSKAWELTQILPLPVIRVALFPQQVRFVLSSATYLLGLHGTKYVIKFLMETFNRVVLVDIWLIY